MEPELEPMFSKLKCLNRVGDNLSVMFCVRSELYQVLTVVPFNTGIYKRQSAQEFLLSLPAASCLEFYFSICHIALKNCLHPRLSHQMKIT